MNFKNDYVISKRSDAPLGSSFWLHSAGHLTGFGHCRFVFEPADHVGPHLITSGQGTVQYLGIEHHVKAGDMFCLLPGIRYEYFEHPDQPWQYLWLHIVGQGAVEFASGCGFTSASLCRSAPNLPELSKIILELRDRLAPPESNAYEIISGLYGFASACGAISETEKEGSDPFDSLVDRARVTIDSSLHSQLNVTELAGALGVGRTKLFLAFREKLGITPVAYLRLARLNRVKQLLANSDRTLADIAQTTGYANEKYLMKTFRQLEGITAGAWRKNQKEKAVELR